MSILEGRDMIQKTILAAVFAALTAFAVAPAPASAASFSLTLTAGAPPYGNAYGYYQFRPHLVCTPTYKRVTTWYRGRPYTHWVQTGQTCHWVYPSSPRSDGDRDDRR